MIIAAQAIGILAMLINLLSYQQKKQRTDPQEQLVQIDRLDHVIVHADTVAPLLGGKIIPSGHKQNRNIFVKATDS